MIHYLSGAVRADMAGLHPYLGFMHTPVMGNARIPNHVAGADSGLYGKPKVWSLEMYLSWLQEVNQVQPPLLFATAPDEVGDAFATLTSSLPVLPMLRELGIPPAFVAQDGIDQVAALTPWDQFDWLFLGGSTEFKLGPVARSLTWEAKDRGKRVHMGRVNSYRRLALAYDWGCDSADGTYVAYGPYKNAPEVVGWLARLEAEEQMRATA